MYNLMKVEDAVTANTGVWGSAGSRGVSVIEAYASGNAVHLFVPLAIAALGIVLRGVSFAFRKAVVRLRYRRLFGAGFAASFGAGALLLRSCRGWRQAGDPVHSWINLTSIHAGVLAVAAVAYLAAVYLVWDARRLGDTLMVGVRHSGRTYCRRA